MLTDSDIKQLEDVKPEIEDVKPIIPELQPPKDKPIVRRRRRSKPPVIRLPVYSAGSDLSVEERLIRFNAETDVEFLTLKHLCTETSDKLQSERDRLRKKEKTRDDSPERRKHDQLIGTVKFKVDTLQRNLLRLQGDLKTRNNLLFQTYEAEKCRLIVEREQRDKTSLTWVNIEALVTTPQQKRLAENGKEAELHAKTVCKIEP